MIRYQTISSFLLSVAMLLTAATQLFAANITFSTGPGYKLNEYNGQEFLSINVGASTFFPYKKLHSFGIEYYFTINQESEMDRDYYSSLIIISYRNYFFQRPPNKETKRTFLPFFALSHNISIEGHEYYSPGLEVQLGFDLIYRNRSVIGLPIDMISYVFSRILDRPQLWTIAFFGGVYYYRENVSWNAGLRLSTGIVF